MTSIAVSIISQLKPPPLPGRTLLAPNDWAAIKEFIESKVWWNDAPCLSEDLDDALLSSVPNFGGQFMMGFDFHLGYQGPRLIEINTNAGGLASLIETCPDDDQKETLKQGFVRALETEYAAAQRTGALKHIAIVDDAITEQWLFPDMAYLADLLIKAGYQLSLITPDKLAIDNNQICANGVPIDFIYNRLIDFRLSQPAHALIRQACIENLCVVSPHPAVYVRVADKRNLQRIRSPLVPPAFLLSDKTLEEWKSLRKKYVFKPLTGAASKGVYRGDHISFTKLSTLPPDTLAQELVPPPRSADGSKYDIRVFTRASQILGVASRHFNGQVMEMRSVGSGIRWASTDGH